jgi:PAS domain S-box-containing protein
MTLNYHKDYLLNQNESKPNIKTLQQIFKKHTILLVEDDAVILESLKSTLGILFKKIYTASNGEEGLKLYFKHHQQLSMVLADYNMPKMNGLELFEAIRDKNKEIVLMLITGSMSKTLFTQALKVNLNEFILKPVQFTSFLKLLCMHVKKIEQQKQFLQQTKEIQTLFSLLERHNLVTKTDASGKILYANDIFCKVSGYCNSEVIGKPHNIVRHPDTPKEIFKQMWKCLKNKQIWQGQLKNRAKDGSSYIVNAMIMPILDEFGNIKEYLSSRHLITNEITENEKIKQFNKMLKKSIIDLKSSSIKQQKNSEEIPPVLNIKHEKNLEQYQKNQAYLLEQIAHLKQKNKMLNDSLNLREKELQEVLEKHDKVYDLHRSKIALELKKIQELTQKYNRLKQSSNDIVIEKNELKKELDETLNELNFCKKRILELEDVVHHYDMLAKVS